MVEERCQSHAYHTWFRDPVLGFDEASWLVGAQPVYFSVGELHVDGRSSKSSNFAEAERQENVFSKLDMYAD